MKTRNSTRSEKKNYNENIDINNENEFSLLGDDIYSINQSNASTSKQIKNKNNDFILKVNKKIIDINYLRTIEDQTTLYEYLINLILDTESIQNFNNYFYTKKNISNFTSLDSIDLKATEFTSIGVFEDISYLPWNTSISSLQSSAEQLRQNFEIQYFRRIKGDGNCYFRAVLINYIELLLINSYEKENYQIFFALIKDLSLTEFPVDRHQNKILLLIVLLYMSEELKLGISNKNIFNLHKCFDILYRSYIKSDNVEKTLIFWMRTKLTDFLKANLDLEVNGLKLVQLIPGLELEDDLSYDKKLIYNYIDKELIKMNEFAEGFPIYVAPLVLKIEINIFHIDSKFIPVLVDFKYYKDLKNSINYVDNYLFDLTIDNSYEFEINLLFKSLHYDTLYKGKFAEKINIFYPNQNCFLFEELYDENNYEMYKSEVLKNINKERKSKNPLNQLFDKEINNEINDHSINDVNINSINIYSQPQSQYEDINEMSKNPPLNKNLCLLCYLEFTETLNFSCGHILCINCFEKKINHILKNYNVDTKSRDISKLYTIDDIISILKNQVKFKFVRCLFFNGCDMKMTFEEFRDILKSYFLIRCSREKSQA